MAVEQNIICMMYNLHVNCDEVIIGFVSDEHEINEISVHHR